jgi:hypothetical protein
MLSAVYSDIGIQDGSTDSDLDSNKMLDLIHVPDVGRGVASFFSSSLLGNLHLCHGPDIPFDDLHEGLDAPLPPRLLALADLVDLKFLDECMDPILEISHSCKMTTDDPALSATLTFKAFDELFATGELSDNHRSPFQCQPVEQDLQSIKPRKLSNSLGLCIAPPGHHPSDSMSLEQSENSLLEFIDRDDYSTADALRALDSIAKYLEDPEWASDSLSFSALIMRCLSRLSSNVVSDHQHVFKILSSLVRYNKVPNEPLLLMLFTSLVEYRPSTEYASKTIDDLVSECEAFRPELEKEFWRISFEQIAGVEKASIKAGLVRHYSRILLSFLDHFDEPSGFADAFLDKMIARKSHEVVLAVLPILVQRSRTLETFQFGLLIDRLLKLALLALMSKIDAAGKSTLLDFVSMAISAVGRIPDNDVGPVIASTAASLNTRKQEYLAFIAKLSGWNDHDSGNLNIDPEDNHSRVYDALIVLPLKSRLAGILFKLACDDSFSVRIRAYKLLFRIVELLDGEFSVQGLIYRGLRDKSVSIRECALDCMLSHLRKGMAVSSELLDLLFEMLSVSFSVSHSIHA